MILCCYYTIDTSYEDRYREMVESAKKYAKDLKIICTPVDDRGMWLLNCGLKPMVIMDVMRDNPGEDIMYLDVDGKFDRRFVAPRFKESIGIFTSHKGEMLSGTIFIKGNDEGRKAVIDWFNYQRDNPKILDQKAFHTSLQKNKTKYYNIGQEYCHIFDWKITGKPFIVHYQESRKTKRGNNMKHSDIPRSVENQRIIHNMDGSISIARHHKKAIAWLDANFLRMPNELTWVKTLSNQMKAINLGDVSYGYIVGKGPSLDHLTAEDFPNKEAPILAINEAIIKLNELELENPIYLIAQDGHFKDSLGVGKSGALISKSLLNFYDDHKEQNIMSFTPSAILPRGVMNITVNVAITILKQCGAEGLGLVSFDGAALGDTRYAEISKTPIERGGNPRRFLEQKARIVACAKGIDIDWITPSAPDYDKSYDTDQPSEKSDSDAHE